MSSVQLIECVLQAFQQKAYIVDNDCQDDWRELESQA